MISYSNSENEKRPDSEFWMEGQTTPEEYALMQRAASSLGNITLNQVAEEGDPIHLKKADETSIVRVDTGHVGYRMTASPVDNEPVGTTSEFFQELDRIKQEESAEN